MEGAQPRCFPLASVICVPVSKLVCMLYVLMAQSAGAQRSRVVPTGFHTDGNQLQWFATAQPWNIHSVVKKNDQETYQFQNGFMWWGGCQVLHHHSPSLPPSPSSAVQGDKIGWNLMGMRFLHVEALPSHRLIQMALQQFRHCWDSHCLHKSGSVCGLL